LLAPDIDLSGFTGDVWHVKDVALALGRAGTPVDLVVGKAAGWIAGDGVRLHELPAGNTILAALRLRRLFRPACPDVLYERRESPKLAASLSWLLNRPFFVEVNGVTAEEKAIQGRPNSMPNWIRRRREAVRGRLLRRARGVVAVTRGLRDFVVSQYGVSRDRLAVIPNGVDLDLFRPMDKRVARTRLGLVGDGPYLVYVGNLVGWQGIPSLLDATVRLRREWRAIQVLIVGDGIERQALEERTAELGLGFHVRFVGREQRERVPLWIGASDIAVMPATLRRNAQIGSSALKMREYLACGRPVVAPDIEGGGPFLEAHGVGRGTRGDDAEDLASVLSVMLSDLPTLDAMGVRARKVAEAELSWDLVARRLLAFFAEGEPKGGVA
jgi:glycosyltransferase involved in cell wall biosynthesis